jgi:hypothetical protein
MGAKRQAEQVLHDAGEAIRELGLHWQIRHRKPGAERRQPDTLVRLRHPRGEIDFAVEIKIKPTHVADILPALNHQDGPTLLVADYINPKLAARLRENQVNFVDAAGNAHLRHDGLYIWVTGRRNQLRLTAQRERRRAFQPSGLKLVFALLCRPELAEADYRTLADVADVALGTVQWVMRDLIQEGYVLRLGRFERRLTEPRKLLDDWLPAYVRELRPRLLLGRFETQDLTWWKDTDLRPYGAVWGGEPAAARLTKHLKPGTLTIYADKIPAPLVIEGRLQMNDAGRVEFREKFWHFDTGVEAPETAPPVLVHADLVALGDPRALETAEYVYEKLIHGPFRKHLARWTG